MSTIGKVTFKNPLNGTRHKVIDPVKNGKPYGAYKEKHTKALGQAGICKPRSPLK